jgi:hypothetical protein
MVNHLEVILIGVSISSVAICQLSAIIDKFVLLDQFLGDLFLVVLDSLCDSMTQDVSASAGSVCSIIAVHDLSIWDRGWRCISGIFFTSG